MLPLKFVLENTFQGSNVREIKGQKEGLKLPKHDTTVDIPSVIYSPNHFVNKAKIIGVRVTFRINHVALKSDFATF